MSKSYIATRCLYGYNMYSNTLSKHTSIQEMDNPSKVGVNFIAFNTCMCMCIKLYLVYGCVLWENCTNTFVPILVCIY